MNLRNLSFLAIPLNLVFLLYLMLKVCVFSLEWGAQTEHLPNLMSVGLIQAIFGFIYDHDVTVRFCVFGANTIWVFWASSVAIAGSTRTIAISPGWAIAYFYIPFVNFWAPFLAIRQLWNLSVAQDGPVDAPAPGFFWPWWLAWLGAMLIDLHLASLVRAKSWDAVYTDWLVFEVLAAILLAIAATCFLRILKGVGQALMLDR